MKNMKLFKAVFFFVICLFVLAFSGRIYAGVVDKVLVVVNDEVVTQREFDRLYEPVKQNFESKFKGEELDRRIAEAKEGILQQLINAKLAVSLAKKKKIEVDEKELDERIEKIQSYYPSEDAFLKALSEKGTNLTEFKKELREQMLAQKIVSEEVASNIVITPAQIKELYEKNKDKMIAPPKAKVRGI
ncbi:MAG: SurA N-terminal domain-containing protein, partial [Candidatus Omnitrophica bacterium]|nr:SurA N-terminal domain-containing protein [Candidatus Omnitrophota bacterium]